MKDEGEDAGTTLEFENMGEPINVISIHVNDLFFSDEYSDPKCFP